MVNECLSTSRLHLSANMKRLKRWSGKIKPEREVSRWLIQMRKDPVEEAPLIVPKVIKQYTRKKKVSVPENTLAAPQDVAAVCSEQSVVKIEVDNHNHVKIKEEYIPDIKILNGDVENYIKMEEPNVPQNNAMTSDRNCFYRKVENHVKLKQEHLTEIKIINGINAQPSCSSKVKKIKTKEELVSKIISSDSYVSEGKQQEKAEITIKMEPEDDPEDTDLDQKNILELEIMNEANVMGQTFQGNDSQDKTLLTEEINIKEEIESDYDSELAVTSNIKEEPAEELGPAVEQEQVTSVTSGSQSGVTQGRGVIVKAYGKKPDMIGLKKCYMVAVNVAPGTSGARRSRTVSLLTDNSQKVVDPEQLAGLKVVAKTQIFTCDMCDKNFLSKTGLRQHMSAAHSVATRFVCHCGAKFTHNFMLLAHTQAHSGSLTCDLCPKRFKTTLKFADHLNTHLKERFFSCPICVRQCTIFSNLQRHAATHKTSDIFQCNSCSASYRCITDLRRHSERDHGEKVQYPCYLCSQSLSSDAEFIAHVKSHDNALHECAFCTMRFTDVLKWEEHSAIHIERLDAIKPVMRPHVCGVCNKRFEFRSILKTHMTSHTEVRPYKCKKCPKTFKTQSAVTEHERGHARPYACPECPARFAKGNSLARHALLHSGERPHACAHCARRFTQRSAMLQHQQRVHAPGLQRAHRGRGGRKRKSNSTPVHR